ncbi:hypothetical protein ACWEKJ_20635 [Amycolatopsis thermoflava]|uniref:hypothetical protein n=1 Tax=Amycolatopsis thermoflava TaxID=84480 RepID=UPI003EBA5820
MAGRQTVLSLVEQGLDYHEIGRRLGIPAGLAYLIATGMPADAGDVPAPEERSCPGVRTASQDLSNPPVENLTKREIIQRWIHERVRMDPQMRSTVQDQ